jgi:hypothetical protein
MPTSTRIAATIAAVVLAAPQAAVGQATSAPADPAASERALREEHVRHQDASRRLREEEDRLRTALDAAKGRLAEAEARKASLGRLVADAERAAKDVRDRIARGRATLDAIRGGLSDAGRRVAALAPLPRELLDQSGPLARRVRLVLQVLDRELHAARRVSVTARERDGALGHEVRLGAIARFFVPANGGPALVEPSGREVPAPSGAALRDVIRQASQRGRGALVRIPWWGGP